MHSTTPNTLLLLMLGMRFGTCVTLNQNIKTNNAELSDVVTMSDHPHGKYSIVSYLLITKS